MVKKTSKQVIYIQPKGSDLYQTDKVFLDSRYVMFYIEEVDVSGNTRMVKYILPYESIEYIKYDQRTS